MPCVCLIDESNLSPNEFVRFYVTAALVTRFEKIPPLNARVDEIRRAAGYEPADTLKWASASRPPHVTSENHRRAKNEVLAALPTFELQFLPTLTHHHVASTKPVATLVEYGANQTVTMCDRLLQIKDDYGILLLDRRPAGDEGDYIKGLFARQPNEPPGKDFSLKRICALGYTMDGASHLASVLDIVLGAFCYCVNERNPGHNTIARGLLRMVTQGMWLESTARGGSRLHNGAMTFLPQRTKSPKVAADFQELTARLGRLLAE